MDWPTLILFSVGVAAACSLLAAFLFANEENGRAGALVASLLVIAVLRLLSFQPDPAEDVANGLGFFLRIIETFFGWVIALVAVLFLHPLARRLRR